jgi:hypothetical protein
MNSLGIIMIIISISLHDLWGTYVLIKQSWASNESKNLI